MEGDNLGKYGIPVQGSPSAPVTQIMGSQSRTFAGLQIKEWIFLVVSLVNLLATLVLTIYRLVIVIENDLEEEPDFTFCILIIINTGFCMFYVIHGLFREMQYELYALVAAITVVLVYCIIEYSVNTEHRTTIKLARLIVACVLAPVNIVLAIVVAREFGWLEFRIVGASEALQGMYREATRFCCLLKFDFQVALSMVILVLQNGTKVATTEIVTLAVGLPFCLAWAIAGWMLTKRELRTAAWIFGFLGFVVPAYVIQKLVRLILHLTSDKDHTSNEMMLVYSVMAAGCLALLVRFIVLIELVKVYRNFGQGLRERAFSTEADERTSLLSAPTSGRRR